MPIISTGIKFKLISSHVRHSDSWFFWLSETTRVKYWRPRKFYQSLVNITDSADTRVRVSTFQKSTPPATSDESRRVKARRQARICFNFAKPRRTWRSAWVFVIHQVVFIMSMFFDAPIRMYSLAGRHVNAVPSFRNQTAIWLLFPPFSIIRISQQLGLSYRNTPFAISMRALLPLNT